MRTPGPPRTWLSLDFKSALQQVLVRWMLVTGATWLAPSQGPLIFLCEFHFLLRPRLILDNCSHVRFSAKISCDASLSHHVGWGQEGGPSHALAAVADFVSVCLSGAQASQVDSSSVPATAWPFCLWPSQPFGYRARKLTTPLAIWPHPRWSFSMCPSGLGVSPTMPPLFLPTALPSPRTVSFLPFLAP